MQTIRELAGSIFSIRKNQEQWDVAGSVCEEEEWSEKEHGFPKDDASLKILSSEAFIDLPIMIYIKHFNKLEFNKILPDVTILEWKFNVPRNYSCK